jgi:glucosamine-6-phosphate deaminase
VPATRGARHPTFGRQREGARVEIIIQPDSEAASLVAARAVARTVRENPRAVIGFATGRTPLALYRHLVRMHAEDGLDFSKVTTFNLDEYVGLPVDHAASFHHYMEEHVFGPLDIPRDRVHVPDGLANDIVGTCERYEEEIRAAGGIDVQILGIGTNGHVGFNEPTSSLASRTRIKTLTPQTRQDSAAQFGGAELVPRHVITMGLGTIIDSRRCLLLAFGRRKAAAVAAMAEGPVTATVPASILQMHPRVVAVVDREAAADLRLTEYYDAVFANKPDWQRD